MQRFASYDFNEFMSAVIEHYPGYLTQMYGWYAPPGKIDFVGKTERLVDDLVRVLKKIGADFDEGRVRETSRVNKSPNAVELPVWDEQLRQEIYRLEYPRFQTVWVSGSHRIAPPRYFIPALIKLKSIARDIVSNKK